MLGQAIAVQPRRGLAEVWAEARMKMKLINLDNRANIATQGCECGGLTLISTTAATETMPSKGRCPVCNDTFGYPTDLEK